MLNQISDRHFGKLMLHFLLLCLVFNYLTKHIVHCSKNVYDKQNQDYSEIVAKKETDGQTESGKTRRSVEKIFTPLQTTPATPILTTPRYFNKSYHQLQINYHHRNYELDLERDHALPTSAPNADILKSNSNPTYPNPNRNNNIERDRHKYFSNSSGEFNLQTNDFRNINQQKPIKFSHNNGNQSQSSPTRSFFTPPLPPEYQHPFADKPTLRGSNNDMILTSSGSYINRRPIPPPSLMPGHERIPLRPPDLLEFSNNENNIKSTKANSDVTYEISSTIINNENNITLHQSSVVTENVFRLNHGLADSKDIPNIRRILSGSNERKVDIPEVLLNHVTKYANQDSIQPTTSPVLLLENIQQPVTNPDINIINGKTKTMKINSFLAFNNVSHDKNIEFYRNTNDNINTSTSEYLGTTIITTLATVTTLSTDKKNFIKEDPEVNPTPSIGTISSQHTIWSLAWNIHVYLSVVLFTILAVYSGYKMLVYNKLTFLFSQSYFVCINFFLVSICFARIFYLCYDAYNLHNRFDSFVSDILLNLPATILTTTFAVLVLFLFLKSLSPKNNRHSALIRPLTVVIGCGVHIVLCITLHYVEFYTSQNQQNVYFYHQHLQQTQKIYQNHVSNNNNIESFINSDNNNGVYHRNARFITNSRINQPQAARVLSLICQIIYIFICFSLGFLYIYLYKILKRILHSKSQNYIHGQQTLSYGIHITIATALLFVLLGSLQIFGAICISTHLIPKVVSNDMDWLKWGYQFSLRLVEIAIITLLLWVTGLKVINNSNSTDNSARYTTNSVRMVSNQRNTYGANRFDFNSAEKLDKKRQQPNQSRYTHQSHLHDFFFPCSSDKSKANLENDFPVVCNTNTHIKNYTLRTGKLLYDDNYAFDSFSNTNIKLDQIAASNNENDIQLSEGKPHQYTYRNPNLINPNDNRNRDLGKCSDPYNPHDIFNHFQVAPNGDYNHYSDCATEATDHYEIPNFDFEKTMSDSQKHGNDVGMDNLGANGTQSISLNENNYSEPDIRHLSDNLYRSPMTYDLEDQPSTSGVLAISYRYGYNRADCNVFHENSIKKEQAFKNHVCEKSKEKKKIHNMLPLGNNCNEQVSVVSFGRKLNENISPNIKKTVGNLITAQVSTAMNTDSEADTELTCVKQLQPKSNSCENNEFVYLKKPELRHKSDNEEEEEDITTESNVECTNLINIDQNQCSNLNNIKNDQQLISRPLVVFDVDEKALRVGKNNIVKVSSSASSLSFRTNLKKHSQNNSHSYIHKSSSKNKMSTIPNSNICNYLRENSETCSAVSYSGEPLNVPNCAISKKSNFGNCQRTFDNTAFNRHNATSSVEPLHTSKTEF